MRNGNDSASPGPGFVIATSRCQSKSKTKSKTVLNTMLQQKTGSVCTSTLQRNSSITRGWGGLTTTRHRPVVLVKITLPPDPQPEAHVLQFRSFCLKSWFEDPRYREVSPRIGSRIRGGHSIPNKQLPASQTHDTTGRALGLESGIVLLYSLVTSPTWPSLRHGRVRPSSNTRTINETKPTNQPIATERCIIDAN